MTQRQLFGAGSRKSLRDALLPKLVSGEVRIGKPEDISKACASWGLMNLIDRDQMHLLLNAIALRSDWNARVDARSLIERDRAAHRMLVDGVTV